MIPLNNYQKTLYQMLSKTNYKVYDEVPKDEEPPLISISDYTIADGAYKNRGYISKFQNALQPYRRIW